MFSQASLDPRSPFRSLLGSAFLCGLLVGSPLLAQDGSPREEDPGAEAAEALQKLLDRETKPLPITTVQGKDDFFTARVPARLLEPVDLVRGAQHLMLDFGAGADHLAECYVYPEDLDLAGSLTSFSDAVFEAVASHYGAIEAKAVLDVTAGAVGNSPYLGIEWLYRSRTENGPTAGQAKHLIASKNRRAIYCQSSSVGYSAAFFHLFRSLVESLEYKDPLPDPYYREISVATLGEHVLGVSYQDHRLDDDSDVEVVEKLSMLVPAEGGKFQAEDSVHMEYSSTAGDLLGQVKVEAADGQIVTHLNLSRFDNGAWAVKGAFRGKNLDTILSKAPVLRSQLGRRVDFREFVKTAEPGASWTQDTWSPDVDPVRLSVTEGTFLGEQPQGSSLQLKTGPKAMSALADDSYSLTFLTVPVGGLQMILRRVYREGDVFYPLTLPKQDKSSDASN